jgi:hypothetical protein
MRALAAPLLLLMRFRLRHARGQPAGKPLPVAPPPPPMSDEGIFCTADVKQCPDGSFVSRNPANGCAFDPCPGAGKP